MMTRKDKLNRLSPVRSITDKQYGGLGDTLEELCRAGIILEEELDMMMLDLVLNTGREWLSDILKNL